MTDNLETFFEYALDPLCVLDESGSFVRVNQAFTRLLGWSEEGIHKTPFLDYVHPGEVEGIRGVFILMTPDGMPVSFVTRCRCKDSSYRRLKWSLFNKGGTIFCSGQELSELSDSLDLFQLLIENSPTGMVLVDQRGVIKIANREATRIFGYSEGELIDQRVEILLPGPFKVVHTQHREAYTHHPESRPMGTGRDLIGLHKGGFQIDVEIGLNPIQTQQGTMILSTIIDLTERKRSEKSMVHFTEQLEESIQKLSRLASTDSLTGLKNRRAFSDHFHVSLQNAAQEQDKISLLLLDIDDFKLYNDSFGHPAGDRLLIEIARLLQRISRANDFIARIGGEEFAIILPGTGVEASRRIARRYLHAFEKTNWLLRQVTASIGVASHIFQGEGAADPQALAAQLFQQADQALYESKANGKNQATIKVI